MEESASKLKGTVTWFDVRTGFCLIRSNDFSEDFLIHRSYIAAVGFGALKVGETVEFRVVKRNNGIPEIFRPTAIAKAYIQGVRNLACNERDGCSAIGHRNSSGETENMEPPDTRLAKPDEDECTGKAEVRDWAMLPREILSIIFKKAGAAVVVASAQFVCKPWKQLSKEPDLWSCVNIKLKDALSISTRMTDDRFNVILLEFIAMVAVDRSAGCLEEFSAEGFGSNVLLDYIAERATRLRCLRLISVCDMSGEAVVEAVKRFSELQEFWISPGSFSDAAVESVSQACPQLKTFTCRSSGEQPSPIEGFAEFINEGAESKDSAIAKQPQHLRDLEISEGIVSNGWLCAMLNSCLRLDHLAGVNLKKKCAGIKDVRSIYDFIDFSSLDDEYFDSDFEFEEIEVANA